MFSIWIGDCPPEKEIYCMRENDLKYGLTLIASENWIESKNFLKIEPLLEVCLKDPRCSKLLDVWESPKNISDIFRIWYLMKNPSEIYIDSDCLLLDPLSISDKIQVPSSQSGLQWLANKHGVELDTSMLKNSITEFVEVYIIKGSGDINQFEKWLDIWSSKYCFRGGIAETICYEPFDLKIIQTEKFKHLISQKGNIWQQEFSI